MGEELRRRVAQTADEATSRWDVNAPYRYAELVSRNDAAYQRLTELILRLVGERVTELGRASLSVLDIGCGLGFLSRSLADLGHSVVGVDPSEASVKMARGARRSSDAGSLSFYEVSLDDYAAMETGESRFDVLIANMTLHCIAELPAFLATAATLLAPDGVLIATIPNPGSYLQRREDVNLDGCDLTQARRFEIPFRIHGNTPHPAEVFFFHRPLKDYASSISAAGLKISHYEVPPQVGPGKPRDISVFIIRHAAHSTS
jgi:2-polyprenyl-3-methyl-5-hydroxy-6-metoxy-1,4-benzoquinol methylase